jgi:glyoxylase-like metal-dependent hydrolase (beta-lactamase superfamily II)
MNLNNSQTVYIVMTKSSWIIPIIFAIVWLGGCGSAPEQGGTANVADYVEVAPRVFSSSGAEGGHNQMVVPGDAVLLIVDAPGDSARARQQAAYWQKLHPNLRPILVLTSSRAEAWAGYAQWKAAFPTLEVWMHPATLAAASKAGVTGGRTLDRTEMLDLGGVQAQFIPAGPAATSGDMVVYLPPQKTLFSGEMVLDYTLPAMTDGDTAQWINRLQELLAAGIDQILPAHGKPLDLEALNWTRQYLVLLRSQICLLKSQGYADDDVYYFCRVPGYDKYTEGNELFRENILYVLKEIREKGNECTLPSKALPKYGPVTINEAQKGDI